MTGNGAQAEWSERIRLGTLSEGIALDFAELPRFADAASLAKLFTDGWRLDYRSPVVRNIRDMCAAHLLRST
ncbi:hypothetical protein M0D68_06830 [Paraburkholderia sp. SEWSISQ10-3 4]|uniref:hypothetical protein n=1 Tax=Paraburkholderia TaxID=1822464 RepID=UPI002250D2E3|nr:MULTISPECIES: hypothetical protein [Paraburkholderia]MCX4137891.1 hypothetical protein [Paraburkholderia aspalathi]MDN7170582.1 hypothetical protein [Paraburkholderia sp. SEWSISQ10-3 4]MDQ6500221.1 hypothetical protein [Paraburkholderia aspalathi]